MATPNVSSPPKAKMEDTVASLMTHTGKTNSMVSFYYRWLYKQVWKFSGTPITWLEDNPSKKNCVERKSEIRGDGLRLSDVVSTECKCYSPFRAMLLGNYLQGISVEGYRFEHFKDDAHPLMPNLSSSNPQQPSQSTNIPPTRPSS
jgi:hypothetical protein